MGIFKTYDIRGIYGSEIDTDTAYKIGRAFARFLNSPSYMAGYDARLHSKEMYDAVIEGLLDEGRDVTGIGLCSTPLLHFSQIKGGFGGGIMVTASHNPPEYHGFKLYDGIGGSVSYTKGLKEIEEIAASGFGKPAVKKGTLSERVTIDEYVDFIAEQAAEADYNQKIVIDPSNGSSGMVYKLLSEKLNLNISFINEKPDGNFPNHSPNPLKEESSKQIAAAVKKTGADFGAIFDGDGDRVLFVDERGERIENYFISALIAEQLLKKSPGSAIVYDLISSRVLPERITEDGGKPVISRVGYTFVYDAMVAEHAIFGSETSGHVYFKVSDSYYTESAAYAVIMLLNLLNKKKEKLSALIAPMAAKYYQSEEINIRIEDKEKALLTVENYFKGARISRLDGIGVGFDDVWFNIRASNTEPVLRIRLEGRDRKTVNEKRDLILKMLGTSE
ncbi:MAG: phosphomannomutase/phosphoglucomutase [Spirochaetes bacterium]|nr:phosphomannomutase/phosphoglucomutase [Spirochaetota bacterium]